MAYYCPEPLSEKAKKFLMSHSRPGMSGLSEVELFSAVSRKVREGGMSRKDGKRVIARFVAHVNGNLYPRYCLNFYYTDVGKPFGKASGRTFRERNTYVPDPCRSSH